MSSIAFVRLAAAKTRSRAAAAGAGWKASPATTSAAINRAQLAASRPRRSDRVDEAAGFGDDGEVVVGVAEHRVDHADALEVMTDLVLVGHADAAMKLDRLLADSAPGAAALDLGGGDGAAALAGVLRLRHHGGEIFHAARLLQGDEHVDRAMLERLERADRDAELLARLEVLDGELVHDRHRADRLGGERGDGEVDGARDDRQRLILRSEQRVLVELDGAEGDLGGTQPVDRRVTLNADTGLLWIDEKEADPRRLARAAGGARRDDDAGGAFAGQHPPPLTAEHGAAGDRLRRRLDIR